MYIVEGERIFKGSCAHVTLDMFTEVLWHFQYPNKIKDLHGENSIAGKHNV